MILNVYKPKGWTSFDVVAKLKKVLGTKKIGHAGTLDPLAEGVLIVLTDDDTKRQAEFMKLPKEYEAEIVLGVESPTYDMEMTLKFAGINFPARELKEKINKILPEFIGVLNQKAPAYSAKKVGGKALYKKAREGQDVSGELPSKEIQIFSFDIKDIMEKEIQTDVGLKKLPVVGCTITCSSGTYIRSIAHDLGEKLGVGGVLFSLKRTKIGDFNIADSKTIDQLKS